MIGLVLPLLAPLLVSLLSPPLVAPAPSASPGVGLAPGDVARLKEVTSFAMAPDGTRVAYVLSVPRSIPGPDAGSDAGPDTGPGDGPAWAELHVVGVDGVSRPYVTGEVNVGDVKWTPDGSAISFVAKRGKDEHKGVWKISLSGGEAHRVVEHPADVAGHAWSPDGHWIAFLAAEAISKERRDRVKKGFTQKVYEEDVRLARVWIAAVGLDGIALKARALPLEGSASDVSWSPVGGNIAVALAPSPLPDDELMRRTLHVVDAASGKVVARFPRPGKLGEVAWSPDGKHLAVLAAEDLHDPTPGRLLVAPSAGGAMLDVLPGYAGDVAAIAWQDADAVMFVGNEGTGTSFSEIDRTKMVRKTHLTAGQKGAPILAHLGLSRDGQSVAFLGSSATHPAEVFLSTHAAPMPRRLTDANPWLAAKRLAPQEVVRWKARDGLEIEGILIRPLERAKGARHPLVLIVHGGPEGHRADGWLTSWSEPGQVLAARGIAVLYPNYRASSGRGVAFSKLDHGDPAGKEFDDLVDGVDYLIGTGLVDRAKVGITGRSYGGYATAWCATRYTERFAAGVAGVALTDLVSFHGTSDIPTEMNLVHGMRFAWEDWPDALARSPIFHANGSRTPLLILHGADDPRVSPSQSYELYRQLKLRGKAPVRLVLYPGEEHLNQRGASRLDAQLRLVQWMEHYLKGPGGAPPPWDLD